LKLDGVISSPVIPLDLFYEKSSADVSKKSDFFLGPF
jgi:hypothetical protein